MNNRKETKYADISSVHKNGTFIKILSRDFDTVITGVTVYKMDKIHRDEQIYKEIEKNHKISFIFTDTVSVDIKAYCVPLMDFFAFDENGYYGTLNGFTDMDNPSPIYYLDKDNKIFFIADNLYDFTKALQNESYEKKYIESDDKSITIYSSKSEAENTLPFITI